MNILYYHILSNAHLGFWISHDKPQCVCPTGLKYPWIKTLVAFCSCTPILMHRVTSKTPMARSEPETLPYPTPTVSGRSPFCTNDSWGSNLLEAIVLHIGKTWTNTNPVNRTGSKAFPTCLSCKVILWVFNRRFKVQRVPSPVMTVAQNLPGTP